MPTIQQTIKSLMALNGKTQRDLAAEMDIFQAALNRTINKRDHRIQADILPISRVLGCTIRLQFVNASGEVVASVDYPQEQ